MNTLLLLLVAMMGQEMILSVTSVYCGPCQNCTCQTCPEDMPYDNGCECVNSTQYAEFCGFQFISMACDPLFACS